MSKMGDYIQEFLEDIGHSLGYSMDNMPEFEDIEIVRTFNIHVWEYEGLTESEYYGVDKNEGKTMP